MPWQWGAVDIDVQMRVGNSNRDINCCLVSAHYFHWFFLWICSITVTSQWHHSDRGHVERERYHTFQLVRSNSAAHHVMINALNASLCVKGVYKMVLNLIKSLKVESIAASTPFWSLCLSKVGYNVSPLLVIFMIWRSLLLHPLDSHRLMYYMPVACIAFHLTSFANIPAQRTAEIAFWKFARKPCKKFELYYTYTFKFSFAKIIIPQNWMYSNESTTPY